MCPQNAHSAKKRSGYILLFRHGEQQPLEKSKKRREKLCHFPHSCIHSCIPPAHHLHHLGSPALHLHIMAQDFRYQSQLAGSSPNRKLGSDAPRDDHQAAHRVPNAIIHSAYQQRSHQPQVQGAMLSFAHSSHNITYSTNNVAHSAQEHALRGGYHTQAHVRNEGGAATVALRALHQDSPTASAAVMTSYARSGAGNCEVVASLDKRIFTSPIEKRTIDAARGSK